MIPLTDEEKKCYNSQNKCYICKKWFVYNEEKDTYKITKKLEITVNLQENLEGLLIAFVI